MNKILLAEDDEHLAFVMKDNLEMQGYEVDHFVNGRKAIEGFEKFAYDLCLLDVMMPVLDGFSVAEKIRLVNPHIPIIFLTAKGMKEDKLTGFRTGGDDYLVKPFSMEELLFRIRVFLKRKLIAEQDNHQHLFCIGAYVFDYSKLELGHEQVKRKLTLKEADLMKELCIHLNQVVKRDFLLKKIWGSNDYFNGRSMDVFISRLRKYLSADDQVELLNHHGTGFRLTVKNQA